MRKADADKSKNINLGVVFPIPAFISVGDGRPRRSRSPVLGKACPSGFLGCGEAGFGSKKQ